MQAIELIARDDFLAQYNVSIDTSDVIEYMRKAIRVWDLQGKYDKNLGTYSHEMNFKDKYLIEFAEIITSNGFCYSFNIADAKDILKLEKY